MSLWTQLQDRNLHHKIPFMRFGSAADRQDRRYECMIICAMSLSDRAIVFDGVVDSISRGGIQFRPAASYLLDRRGENVSIALGHQQLDGVIVATRQSGYGVTLAKRLDEDEINDILEEFS